MWGAIPFWKMLLNQASISNIGENEKMSIKPSIRTCEGYYWFHHIPLPSFSVWLGFFLWGLRNGAPTLMRATNWTNWERLGFSSSAKLKLLNLRQPALESVDLMVNLQFSVQSELLQSSILLGNRAVLFFLNMMETKLDDDTQSDTEGENLLCHI